MVTQVDEPRGVPGSVVVRSLNGVRISYRIATTDEFVLESEYAAARFLPKGYVPPEDATILDIGAHIGVFAALVARHVPRGVVHALEPSSENFELLAKNLRDNDSDNAFAHRLALGASNGSVRLHHAPGSVGHSLYANPDWVGEPWEPRPSEAPPPVPYEDVTAQTLADFLDEQGIEKVAFMKMNIEGAEYDVLLGASDDTLRAIANMQVELHPEAEGLAERLIARLRGIGFDTEFVPTDHPAVKGWLTARR